MELIYSNIAGILEIIKNNFWIIIISFILASNKYSWKYAIILLFMTSVNITNWIVRMIIIAIATINAAVYEEDKEKMNLMVLFKDMDKNGR